MTGDVTDVRVLLRKVRNVVLCVRGAEDEILCARGATAKTRDNARVDCLVTDCATREQPGKFPEKHTLEKEDLAPRAHLFVELPTKYQRESCLK